MNRSTKIINIAGKDVVVKDYATAREAQAIQSVYFKGTQVEVVGDQPKVKSVDLGIQFEVEKETIKQLVVSFGGITENVLEICLDLPSDEYEKLMSELDAIYSKKNKLTKP